MPRRRKTKKPRRRKSTAFNLLSIAETYMLTNALTQSAFRTNPMEFFLTPRGLRHTGHDGTWVISLPEIFKFGANSPAYAGAGDSLFDAIRQNLGVNPAAGRKNRDGQWVWLLGQMIAIPIGFRLIKRMGRPFLTRARKALKDIGLKGTVTV